MTRCLSCRHTRRSTLREILTTNSEDKAVVTYDVVFKVQAHCTPDLRQLHNSYGGLSLVHTNRKVVSVQTVGRANINLDAGLILPIPSKAMFKAWTQLHDV